MTKEEYFGLKEGDVLVDENGREVYVAIDMLGMGTPDDVPIGYVIMAYEDHLYSSKYVKICRNELEKWTFASKNVKPILLGPATETPVEEPKDEQEMIQLGA